MKKKDKKAKKPKKQLSGLMAGLVDAGVLSSKEARGIKRDQRKERQKEKKEHGHKGVEELERRKREDLERVQAEKRARDKAVEQARQEAQRLERIQELMRDRQSCAGKKRYHFIRPDRIIDFVDVDDTTLRQLGGAAAAIVRGPNAAPGVYEILPVNSKLDELRQLAPELVLFPRSSS